MNFVTRSEFREALLSLSKDIQKLRETVHKSTNTKEVNSDPQERTVFAKLDSVSSIETRTPDNEQKTESRYQFWSLLLSGFTLLAVAAYAVITGQMWYEMQKQTITSQKQFESMDRPWVDLDVAITAPVTYDKNGLQIVVTFVPKNIGRSPAQNVSIAPRLIPGSMGTDVHEMQKRICDNRATASDEPLRYVLFPNRSYEQRITMQITAAEINSQWSTFELSQGPIDPLPVLLVGCVDYTYESSPRHHQTGFTFDVLMKDGRTLLRSRIPLLPDSVGLMEHSFGGHFAN
jgi:hypothetical protein